MAKNFSLWIKKNYILLFIILLSFLVRVVPSHLETFSADEGVTLYHAQKSVIHNIIWPFFDDYVPFYHILLSLWLKIATLSIFSSRFLSVLFGTVSVFLLYLIVEKLFNKKTATYSSLIFALSPFAIFYSQEVRVYSLYLLLGLLSIYFYLVYIKKGKYKWSYIITTILAIYTHGMALLIPFFQTIHFIFQEVWIKKRSFKDWLFIQLIIFVFFLPLIYFVVQESLKIASGKIIWVPPPSIIGIIKFFYLYVAGMTFLLPNLIVGMAISIIFFILIGYAIINFFYKKNKDSSRIEKESVIFLLAWFIIPIIGLIIYSTLFSSVFIEKYIIFVSPVISILVSLGIIKLKGITKNVVVVSIIILLALAVCFDIVSKNNPNWTGASDYIKEKKSPNDVIIMSFYNVQYTFSYYFNKTIFQSENITLYLEKNSMYSANDHSNLNTNTLKNNDIWLVLHASEYTDPNATVYTYFTSNYNLAEYKKFTGVSVYHFSKSSKKTVQPPTDYRAPQYNDDRLIEFKAFVKKVLGMKN